MSSIDSVTSGAPLQLTVNPKQKSFWSSYTPSFGDVLDIINPLQHIPIVSNIYESLTGDTQSTASKLAGGALFGGPIGFLASLFDSIVESATGKDMSSHALATIEGDTPQEVQTADASASSAPSPTNRMAYAAYQQMQSMMG